MKNSIENRLRSNRPSLNIDIKDSELVSFALLNVNWEHNKKGALSNYLPFVKECLASFNQKEVCIKALRQSISERFKLDVPLAPLTTILKISSKEGWGRVKEGKFIIDIEITPSLEFNRNRALVSEKYNSLIQKLIQFSFDEYGITINSYNAERTLVNYIDKKSLHLLRVLLEGRLDEKSTSTPSSPNLSYILNSFIKHLYLNDEVGFSTLEAVVKGRMLGSMLYLPNSGSIKQKFKKTYFYIDTPVLIHLLGYAGHELQQPQIELTLMLKQLGGHLRCFEHTVLEITNVLENVADFLKRSVRVNHTHNEILIHCMDSKISSCEVEYWISKIRDALSDLNIGIANSPPHTNEYCLNENKLEEILEEKIHYRSENTREKDVNSISNIFRLRKGRTCDQIENSKAVFITNNYKVVSACTDFIRIEYPNSKVPLCITDELITTLAWIKQPQSHPDLQKKQIIADSYAALNPTKEFWLKAVTLSERLRNNGIISDQNFLQIVNYKEERSMLMEFTLGDINEIKPSIIHKVLAKSTNSLSSIRNQVLTEKRQKEDAKFQAKQAKQSLEKFYRKLRVIIDYISLWAGRIAAGSVFLLALFIISLFIYYIETVGSYPLTGKGIALFMLAILICEYRDHSKFNIFPTTKNIKSIIEQKTKSLLVGLLHK